MKKQLDYIKRNSIMFLVILLGINFAIRLLIYSHTTLLYFGDYNAYLKAIDIIKENGSISLRNGNYLYMNSYIGYFFKYVIGSIDYYFIFNCLLGTLTSFFLYLICVKLAGNKLVGLLTVLLHCIYLEFMVFSAIFYTPIIMMFILSVIILLLIHYFEVSGYKRILIIVALLILVNGTYYFKGELSKLWILLILFGLMNFKKKQVLIGFVLLGGLLTLSTRVLRHHHILPYKEGNISNNNFVFFGHTPYGGDGGDGAFIYKENEERYNAALAEYCKRNNIITLTRVDKNNFQREEIRKFITNHPLKWINLQIYKFFRFFGVVPETNSYKILVSGFLKGQRLITAIILVIPFALMVLLLIITFDFASIKDRLNQPGPILMGLLVLYYIAASVFYGQYQERYRMPLMACLLIPYLSWSLIKFNFKQFISNKKVLILKTGVILLLLAIWFSQTYNALVVHKERYMKTVGELTSLMSKSPGMN